MFKKALSLAVIVCFILTSLSPYPQAHADPVLGLPAPGSMVNLSPAYEPVMIKGLTVHKDNPFLFDFIVDVGQDKMAGEPLKKEGEKLIKYFLASLAIPDKDLWVNLSPYEKNKMIPEALGQTDMGRDLLEQDYILKQITASLIYPERDLGRKFWDKVYSRAEKMYGTTQIPVNTFNKVWIMADRAEVYEHNQTAFVVGQHLKVMLEEDYLALRHHTQIKSHTIASQMVRQIILPELEKEINTGRNFANLRQIFNSIILSSWYKKNLKEALLNQVYADRSRVKGINLNDPTIKQQIYEQYLKAYKKGVFNYVKEDVNAANGQTLPRKYFSGGITNLQIDPAMTTDRAALANSLPDRAMVDFKAGFVINGLADAAMTAAIAKAFDKKVRNFTAMGRPTAGKDTLMPIFIREMNAFLPVNRQIVTVSTGDYFRGIDRLIKGKYRENEKDLRISDERNYRKYADLIDPQELDAMKRGALINDKTTFRIINEILKEDRIIKAGHIFFNGFPRNMTQWNAIKDGEILFRGKPLEINFFLNIKLPEEIAYFRASLRGRDDDNFKEAIVRQSTYNSTTQVMVEEIAMQRPGEFISINSYHPDDNYEDSVRKTYDEFIRKLHESLGVPMVYDNYSQMFEAAEDGAFETRRVLNITTKGSPVPINILVSKIGSEWISGYMISEQGVVRLNHGMVIIDRDQFIRARQADSAMMGRPAPDENKVSIFNAHGVSLGKFSPDVYGRALTIVRESLNLQELAYLEGFNRDALNSYMLVLADKETPQEIKDSIKALFGSPDTGFYTSRDGLWGIFYLDGNNNTKRLISLISKLRTEFEAYSKLNAGIFDAAMNSSADPVQSAFSEAELILNQLMFPDVKLILYFQPADTDSLRDHAEDLLKNTVRNGYAQNLANYIGQKDIDFEDPQVRRTIKDLLAAIRNKILSTHFSRQIEFLDREKAALRKARSLLNTAVNINDKDEREANIVLAREELRKVNNSRSAGVLAEYLKGHKSLSNNWQYVEGELQKIDAETYERHRQLISHPPGGIDLSTSNGMQWKVSRDGNGVEMNIDPALMERVKREGIGSLSPVIFNITPVVSIWSLVGLEEH